MRPLNAGRLIRLWLLTLALFFGQMAMLAHGFEHLDGGESPHTCRLCLAGQNVDGPVPPATLPSLLPALTYTIFPQPLYSEAASAPRAIHPARGPPAA